MDPDPTSSGTISGRGIYHPMRQSIGRKLMERTITKMEDSIFYLATKATNKLARGSKPHSSAKQEGTPWYDLGTLFTALRRQEEWDYLQDDELKYLLTTSLDRMVNEARAKMEYAQNDGVYDLDCPTSFCLVTRKGNSTMAQPYSPYGFGSSQ
ncbi:unnamed protein product [Amoebophrya sp. A25]|nr:unnamed protein product [Amoebophrya sp. A25]|eukprot:GSA25T00009280001.1